MLTQQVKGERAHRLAKCFSKGVIKVVRGKDGEKYAQVADTRRDTCSREVFRHEVGMFWRGWAGREVLVRVVGSKGLCAAVQSEGSLHL